MTASPPPTTSAVSERRPAGAAGSPIDAARSRFDEALLALREIADPAVAVRRVEEKLSQALRECYLAIARRTDYHGYRGAVEAALEAARAALGVLQETPSADPAVERALGLVAAALGALLGAGSMPAPGTLGGDFPDGAVAGALFLPATVDVPAVVSPPRTVLTPAMPLPLQSPPPPPVAAEPPPPPPVRNAADLAAVLAAAQARLDAFENPPPPEPPEPAPARKPPPAAEADARAVVQQISEPAVDEGWLLFERARNCLEELAGLGNMRRPTDLEPWAAPRTERRLLARVDAIVACGQEVLPRLVKQIEDRPVPDPELTWALVFLFGSFAGDDAADQVARLVLAADLEAPDMLAFVADALALAPSPALERPLRAWLEPERAPALRAAALSALARRRRLTFAETSAIVEAAERDGDARLLLAATRALGLSSGPLDVSVLDRLLRRPDATVVRPALVSAFLLRCRLGLVRARAITESGRGHFADAALFVALAGEADCWELLKFAARTGAPPSPLDALGWYGNVRAVDILLDVLAGKNKAAHGAAAAALHRLTGAGLTDDDQAGRAADDERPLGGAFGPPPRVAELSTKHEVWAGYWERHRAEADPARRHRYGHLWSPEDNLWELADESTGAADRQLALVELCARTGADVPIDLEGFVSRQQQHIAELRAHAERSGARAGEWPTKLPR